MREWNDFFNQSHHQNIQNNSSPPQAVKVLVEIANSMFDFNLSKKIKMNSSIQEIQDISWSTTSIHYQINLNANLLWVSGELVAQITYTKGVHSKIYIQTLHFPWKKTCHLQYTYPPIPPLCNEKKHFQVAKESSIEHYEQTIYDNEYPLFEITSTEIVTSKEILHKNSLFYLQLDINCQIHFRIFQFQVIRK
jgi:hypothetical protein